MSLETFFGSEKFNLFQTITPYKGSKKGLLIYRIICLIILSYGLYGSVYVTIHHNPHETRDWIYFAYFTNQTFFCIMLYFMIGIINYFHDKNGTLNGRLHSTFVHVLVHIFYNILFPLAVIVTLVFWCLMFPKMETFYFTYKHWAQELIQHLFQSFMIGIDWFLITVPTNYAHFISNVYFLYIGLVVGWSFIGFLFSALQKFKNRNRMFIDDNKMSRIKDGYELA
ncbi:hypothetical protein PIROE2DRAFT_7384 [Piromyces sp. E2]|nr:hypothetical protein PIROE2DRAFT_7384 [Piromyces sp. E2]|eukprot:OUM65545.1 hypothetical protein PIROE2DRAFT_7384 [Piromyces sp. E2]